MKSSSRRIAFFVAYITIAGGLWTASNGWERGWAAKDSESSISPNGCYRIDSFKPYWVLPDFLHPMPHPFGDLPPKWFVWWGNPAFLRLYDHRNGDLISETEIYDAESAGGQLDWGNGSGDVWIGMIRMDLNLPDCPGDVPGKMRREQ